MALIYQTAEGLAVPTDFSWLHRNCCIHWKALTHHLQVWGSCFWKPAKILKISGQYLTLIFQISLETEQWLKYSEPQHQTCACEPQMSSGGPPLLLLPSPPAVRVHRPALELQMHRAASSCLYLWGWQAGLGFLSLLFSTNTRCRAACFYLQKILVLNYISSRNKCLGKVQITWKNEANIKRKTPQTKETSRNYSFAAAHCSETTNSEIREKRKERERSLEYFLPKKAFSPFYFISTLGEWII